MNASATARLAALVLAAGLTAAMLTGIHGLASPGDDNAQMARAAASQPST